MDAFRYIAAVLMLVSMPGAIVFWFTIHPFIAFWRVRGLGAAYGTGFGIMAVVGILMYIFRQPLLGYGLEANMWFFYTGVGFCIVSFILERLVRRHLKFRILVGVPEIENTATQQLLDSGMFQLVRHPRYLTIMVGTIGWSLICHYTTVYVLAGVTIPLLAAVAVIEERELRERFGTQYEDYARHVPRLLPTLGGLRRMFNSPDSQ